MISECISLISLLSYHYQTVNYPFLKKYKTKTA